MTTHVHRPRGDYREECYRHCVTDSGHCDPRSHGWMLRVETCRCGATRHRNMNSGFTEAGRWIEKGAVTRP